MEPIDSDWLTVFDQLSRKMDGIYHGYSKALGISDSALWLLYALHLQKTPCTQKALSEMWHYPLQTLHSALKKLEAQGLLECRSIPGNRKNKLVALTEQGRALAQAIIPPLTRAETRAFQGLGRQETEQLLALTGKYVRLLQQEVEAIRAGTAQSKTPEPIRPGEEKGTHL